MNKKVKKILSIAVGIIFMVFLALLPQIMIRGTVSGVKTAVKLKNIAEKRNEKQPPLATIAPIEKEGFFHFLPGAKTYALEDIDWKVTSGQNLISPRTPEEVINEAKNSGASIVFSACSKDSYSWDYSLALAKLAKQNGLSSTFSCNGCAGNDFFKKIIPFLDAAEIEVGDTDIKYCASILPASSDAVMKNISAVKASGVHLEISYFINPSLGDKETEIKSFLTELKKNSDTETIIHFIPSESTTTTEILKKARDWARADGFKYVYTDGVNDLEGETTFCADGSIALKRQGNFLLQNNLNNGKCKDGTVIPGIWK
jgi:pyruvate formate lyase activating enzyme